MERGTSERAGSLEVYFVDVAQGSCQIVLLGDRRALVIDTGARNGTIPTMLLSEKQVRTIEYMAITHGHSDHVGGALGVYGGFRGGIEKLGFVEDHKFNNSKFWARVRADVKAGTLDEQRLQPLFRDDAPLTLWSNAESAASLHLLWPTQETLRDAVKAKTPNLSSAVTLLQRGDCRIVFTSDAPVNAWRAIRQLNGRRIDADVISVPHHAGIVADDDADYDWLYDNGVWGECAVISVGTLNGHEHPLPTVINKLAVRGAQVVCTQITTQCCKNLEELRPGVIGPLLHISRSTPYREVRWKDSASRNVACGGTVVVDISGADTVVRRIDEHQAGVDELVATGQKPLCRAALRIAGKGGKAHAASTT